MQVTVNGESTEIDDAATMSALVAQLDLLNRRLAVEYNGEILPRSAWKQTRLTSGDRIEIVHAIGGGSN